MLKAIDETYRRTPDSTLNGVKYEFKNPEGNSRKTVKNQLKKTVGTNGRMLQCDRVAITNVLSDIKFETMCSQAESIIRNDEFEQIAEMLIVDKSGSIRRYKR